jgi:hypothetical protein
MSIPTTHVWQILLKYLIFLKKKIGILEQPQSESFLNFNNSL